MRKEAAITNLRSPCNPIDCGPIFHLQSSTTVLFRKCLYHVAEIFAVISNA